MLERLENAGLPASVRLVAVHQLTPEIAEDLGQVQRAVFVDARIMEASPGAGLKLTPITPEDDPASGNSHHFPPAALLALAGQLGGAVPKAWTLSAPAMDLSVGEGLSPACEAWADDAVALLQHWLESGGEQGVS